MILHIFPDEKFIDLAIDNFENVFPGKSRYLIGIPNKETQIKYIKKNLDKVLIAPYGSQKFSGLAGNLLEYEAVVMHYLDNPKMDIINNAPEGVNFVWNSWGGDIYNDLSDWRYKLYSASTSKLLAKVQSKNLFEYYLRLSFPFLIIKNLRAEIRLFFLKKTIKKINYYSTVISTEKIIVENIFKIKGSYVPFNYISDMFNPADYNRFKMGNSESKNILLGNSAAPTNNHVEAINILSEFNLNENKVYIPLSYGGDADYIKKINEYGQKILGKNFYPLDSMLQQDEYFNLISSCSVCIMNHYRQNGMGNIFYMIWLGSKVFLSENNPAYPFLCSLGILLYSIENDLAPYNNDSLFDPLTDADKLNNKRIIEEHYGYKVILQRISNFINVISAQSRREIA